MTYTFTYDLRSFFGFGQPPTVAAWRFEPVAVDNVSPPSKLVVLVEFKLFPSFTDCRNKRVMKFNVVNQNKLPLPPLFSQWRELQPAHLCLTDVICQGLISSLQVCRLLAKL